MAQYDPPDKAQVEAFGQLVTQIAAIPPDDILRSDLGGNNFPYALRLQELYTIMASLGIGHLPESRLRNLHQSATQTLQLFLQIRSLDRSNLMNLGVTVKQLSDQTRQRYENEFDSLATCVALFQVQAGGLESWKQKAMATQQALDGVATQAQASLDELKRNVEVAGKAAEMNALSSYAKFFDKAAVSHKRAAWGWLIATSALFAATVGVAYWLWVRFGEALTNPDALTTAQSVQLAVTKVVILSTMFTVAVACSRVYRSHRHNYVVNEHRKNALQTFQAFVNAPEADAQTKSAVLLEATKCIFSQQPTGYISSEQESQSSQILEIVRQLGPKS
jgi:hypothetical protein